MLDLGRICHPANLKGSSTMHTVNTPAAVTSPDVKANATHTAVNTSDLAIFDEIMPQLPPDAAGNCFMCGCPIVVIDYRVDTCGCTEKQW
jgi:hypothetical protein